MSLWRKRRTDAEIFQRFPVAEILADRESCGQARCTELRVCACGTRFEPAPGTDPTACRRCSGMVCPECSGPTIGGRICQGRRCRPVLERLESQARREDVRREAERRAAAEADASMVEFRPRRAAR